ncbi:UDP-glycosyltransferase 91C1 [Ipomoea triloba]|uniref:UDP-glycosyltransferase 91C1 n=1 Tax=Ipomoea triloba TaxID=35885 RepID=UPI00125CF2F4|nr:UDP-glycosyltransferase 91C1 [Ipomoea triloba]
MGTEKPLHIVMFPWLAIGHLIPFHHLSKCLAQRGHKVSFISTPRNLERLPTTPSHLAPFIHLVSLPLPKVENLPHHAESSMDIPHHKAQFLKIAFDNLESPLTKFLQNSNPFPDWIIYDYASHWLPRIATQLKISSAYLSLFTAATMAFIGPPSVILSGGREFNPEAVTVAPNWVPFQSDVVYRPHEIMKYSDGAVGNESGTPDEVRFGLAVDESDIVLFRTCVEFEPEWFDLVCKLYNKPVISIGVLPPEMDGGDQAWIKIKEWLDEQRVNSVIYVALGTEVTLSQTELRELATGLEKCGLPFFWVLRNPPGSTRGYSEMLPTGFTDRVRNRGVVSTEWVPQAKILSHPAIAGFLTHCGWNSVIEGLCCGRVLIMFPVMNDQGLNARLLAGKKVGVEIPRDERDGSFTSDSVAESVELAVLSEAGESLRANARRMKELFGDGDRNGSCMDSFVSYLRKNKTKFMGSE